MKVTINTEDCKDCPHAIRVELLEYPSIHDHVFNLTDEIFLCNRNAYHKDFGCIYGPKATCGYCGSEEVSYDAVFFPNTVETHCQDTKYCEKCGEEVPIKVIEYGRK